MTPQIDPQALVRRIADDLHCPLEEVERVYAREVDALNAIARLPQFVPVIAARHTREALKRDGHH